MTEKTKEKLGLSTIILTSVAGLGCVGAGIWAIVDMPKPYINQWVNMADKKFDFNPIMGTCDIKFIESWAKAKGISVVTNDVIKDYYLDRLTTTPEIFVEDFLSHVYNTTMKEAIDEGAAFTNNTLRLSDPSIKQPDKEKTEYFLSFRWDQQMEYTLNNEKFAVDWYIQFKDVPVSLMPNKGKWVWAFTNHLVDRNWTGIVDIKSIQGFEHQTKTDGPQNINHENFQDVIKNPWFYEFDYISTYLANCWPNKK